MVVEQDYSLLLKALESAKDPSALIYCEGLDFHRDYIDGLSRK